MQQQRWSAVRFCSIFATALILASPGIRAQDDGTTTPQDAASQQTAPDAVVSPPEDATAGGEAPAAADAADQSAQAAEAASADAVTTTDAAAPDAGTAQMAADATDAALPDSIPVPAASAAPAAVAVVEDDQQRLPDVVVTSQKIAQTLEEVPMSVSTVDGDFIRKSGLNNFADVQAYTPNVSINLNGTSGTFAIRGFATPDTNPGFDPSVGAVIDGVYYGRSQFITPFFYDLDRMEVLRGPQGTLFGKNSTAGVLNLVTRAPENQFALAAEVQGTSYNDRVIRPMIQFPIGGDVSVRISGSYAEGTKGTEHNTFLDRPENNPEPRTLRARMRYVPDDNATFDLEAFYSHEKMNNAAFQFASITPKMLAAGRTYDPLVEGKVDDTNSANYPALSDGLIRGANATFSYNLDGRLGIPELTVTTIMSGAESVNRHKDLDADFSPIPFVTDHLDVPTVYRQITDEVRFVGRGTNFLGIGGENHNYNFVTGAFLSSSNFRTSDIFNVESLGGAATYCFASDTFCDLFGNGLPLPGGVSGTVGQTLSSVLDRVNQLSGGALDQSATVRLNQNGQSYSLFGQFEAFFFDDWALIGGLRYGNETKSAIAHSESRSALIKAITSQEDHTTPLSINETDYSPKAGIKWQPNKDLSAFLTFGRGYKSGGFNSRPLSPENLTYEPEQATSVEMGTKAVVHFLGGPMRLSATIYQTNFNNLQVSTFIGGNFVVLNAASAVSRGFDFDFHWLTPAHGFSVTGSAGLADARYRSYPCAPAIADSDEVNNNPACVNDMMTNAQKKDIQDNTQDLTGKRLSFAPRWTASLIPAYQLPFETILTTMAVDVLYRGNRYLDVDLDPKKLQQANTIFNTRLTLESPTHVWAVSLVAHNITDRVFSDQAISQPLAPGNVLYYRTDYGRYVSGNLTMQF